MSAQSELDKILDQMNIDEVKTDEAGANKATPKISAENNVIPLKSSKHKKILPKEELITPKPETQNDMPQTDRFHELYESSVEKLLKDYENDRAQLNGIVQNILTKIGVDGEKPTRIYYETLSSLLKTRSESSTTIINLLNNLLKKTGNSDTSLGSILNELDNEDIDI